MYKKPATTRNLVDTFRCVHRKQGVRDEARRAAQRLDALAGNDPGGIRRGAVPPDFTARHSDGHEALIEIVGFWTQAAAPLPDWLTGRSLLDFHAPGLKPSP
ncbi:MAG: hypothetical protein ACREV5_20970, partial [Steroidobacter sp.]